MSAKKCVQHQMEYIEMLSNNSYLEHATNEKFPNGRSKRLRKKPDTFDCSVIYDQPQRKSIANKPSKPVSASKSKPRAKTKVRKTAKSPVPQTPISDLKNIPFDFQDTVQKEKTLEKSKNLGKSNVNTSKEKAKNTSLSKNKARNSKQKSRQSIKSRKSSGDKKKEKTAEPLVFSSRGAPQEALQPPGPLPKSVQSVPQKILDAPKVNSNISKKPEKEVMVQAIEKLNLNPLDSEIRGSAPITSTPAPNHTRPKTSILQKMGQVDAAAVQTVIAEAPIQIPNQPKIPVVPAPKLIPAPLPNRNFNNFSSAASTSSRFNNFQRPNPVQNQYTNIKNTSSGNFKVPNISRHSGFSDTQSTTKSTVSRFGSVSRPRPQMSVLQNSNRSNLPLQHNPHYLNQNNMTKITEERTLNMPNTVRDSGHLGTFHDTASTIAPSIVNAPSVIMKDYGQQSYSRDHSGNTTNTSALGKSQTRSSAPGLSLSDQRVNNTFQHEREVIKLTEISIHLKLKPMEIKVIEGPGVKIEFINPEIFNNAVSNMTRTVNKNQKYIVSRKKVGKCEDIGVQMIKVWIFFDRVYRVHIVKSLLPYIPSSMTHNHPFFPMLTSSDKTRPVTLRLVEVKDRGS